MPQWVSVFRCQVSGKSGEKPQELNVPQSIIEYRPEAHIKAYISDPATFRYGGMPAHPDLTEAMLDDLIAYFRAMSVRKHDPTRTGANEAPKSPAVGATH